MKLRPLPPSPSSSSAQGAWLEYALREDARILRLVRHGEDVSLLDAAPDDGVLTAYLTCFTMTIRMVVGGEFAPVTTTEKAAGSVFALLGGIMMAVTYGNVAVSISSFYAESSNYQRKMEYLWASMERLRLPRSIQDRVYNYYDYMHKQHGSLNGTLNAFIPELSKNLSSEVLLYLRIGLVTNVPFFQVENATRARLASVCA